MRVLALVMIMFMIVPLRSFLLLIPVRMPVSTCSSSFLPVRVPVFLLPMPVAVTVSVAVTMPMPVSMAMVEEGVRVEHDLVYQEDEGVSTEDEDKRQGERLIIFLAIEAS
jgi:hypothetical protein